MTSQEFTHVIQAKCSELDPRNSRELWNCYSRWHNHLGKSKGVKLRKLLVEYGVSMEFFEDTMDRFEKIKKEVKARFTMMKSPGIINDRMRPETTIGLR